MLLGRKADADSLALHLLARTQGAAVLANAFQDGALLKREAELLHEWLQTEARRGAAPP